MCRLIRPLSYTRPGVPQGRISEKLVHTSKLYGGMETNYWIYVPAQYDPAVPAALMVWQDGERYISRNVEEQCRLCPSLYRLQEVTDNLIHDKKIPVMIHVFVSPGTLNGKPLRSILYDTVSDKYGQFLLEELLPEVYAKYNIRKDAYSRAIQGQSSGGIAAFTVAFNRPESFSRVYTVVGSFTALQWKPGELDGGNIYPFKVRREPKRNLRVWMNDGSEDQEANSGSWPLQNIQLANSLKLKGYDFHFSFGGGSHHAALAASELPECLTWLWRDYDPAKTAQTYEQSAEEQVEAAVPCAHLQPLIMSPHFWILSKNADRVSPGEIWPRMVRHMRQGIDSVAVLSYSRRLQTFIDRSGLIGGCHEEEAACACRAACRGVHGAGDARGDGAEHLRIARRQRHRFQRRGRFPARPSRPRRPRPISRAKS